MRGMVAGDSVLNLFFLIVACVSQVGVPSPQALTASRM